MDFVDRIEKLEEQLLAFQNLIKLAVEIKSIHWIENFTVLGMYWIVKLEKLALSRNGKWESFWEDKKTFGFDSYHAACNALTDSTGIIFPLTTSLELEASDWEWNAALREVLKGKQK